MTGQGSPTPAGAASDPAALLRDRNYVVLLVFSAVIGVPVAVIAYYFLVLISKSQNYVYATLPKELGLTPVPTWWPIFPLVLSGLLVGLTLQHLRGTGGHKPAEGFHAGGGNEPADLPGVILAALATLCLGAVLGPEAPLIAIGGGLGVLAIRLVKKDAPPMAAVVIGGAGSFAAISTLLGSPLVGAFLLMEAVGLGGPMLDVLLMPGLVAAGIGALIFVGLDNLTGLGTFSLNVGPIPHFGSPTVAEFLWAIVVGVVVAVLAAVIKRLALAVQPVVERRKVMLTPVVGLIIAGFVMLFTLVTDKPASYVLFSGQSALPLLIEHAGTWSVGALLMVILCKGAAYSASLSSFRGGPVFPSVFIGAAVGIAFSHLPGLPMVAGVAIGMGGMTAAMLGLPLVSVLLTALFLSADGVALTPLIIVSVAVSYITSARIAPAPSPAADVTSAPA